MPNQYFQFKQFMIFQDKCAMKVCTDSCLFGAWVAEKIKNNTILPNTVLDIGAGTGLLSLMLAQETNAIIDAVEIDELSFLQATSNFSSSPWSNNLKVYLDDINNFSSTSLYDVIISNPPFFENNLKSKIAEKNIALHSELLTIEQLFTIAKKTLKTEGHFFTLLPYSRREKCLSIANKYEFHLIEEMMVQQTETHEPFRSMFIFSRIKSDTLSSRMIIKEKGNYSISFTQLLQPYYLNL